MRQIVRVLAVGVMVLLLLAVLSVLLLFEIVLLDEKESFFALVCGAGIVGSIWGGVRILKSQKTVVSGLMMLFFAGVVGVTFFYVAQGKTFADGELMATMTLPADVKAYVMASATSAAGNSGGMRVTLGYLAR